jgi:hypothetical protein
MKSIATLLVISFLFGPAWAVTKRPLQPITPENQVPYSFLPPQSSNDSAATLTPIPDLPYVQVAGDTLVAVAATPFRQGMSCLVQGINASQAKGLAGEIARFLASQHPAETTTLQLPPAENRKVQPFDSILESALRQQGFAVSHLILPGAVLLSYQITRKNGEIFIRLMVNHAQITRIYRDDMVSLTPFTLLKEGGQPE